MPFSIDDMSKILERQERETRERRHRRAESKRVQRELDQQIVIAVALLDEENQSRRGSKEERGPNVDKHRHFRGKNLLEDYFIPTSLCSDVDFRRRYRMQPYLFNKFMHDIYNYDEYFVQKCDAAGVLGLLLEQMITTIMRMLAYGSSADQVDEIARMGKFTTLESLVRFCDAVETLYTRDYLRRSTSRDLQRLLQKAEVRGFSKMIAVAGFDTWIWHAFFGVAGCQNDLNVLGQSLVFNDVLRGESPNIIYEINNIVYHGYKKDVERCFGILQARLLIIRGAARLLDEEVLRSIMMTCIILHNMIVDDKYDYDAAEVYELDPMNTALTRIYERLIGPSGEPLEHKPLVRDGHFMTRMIDRYTEMQSSYINERHQVDLMEHLWAVNAMK
ncbi:unnamed protein product [Prunus armeniaca]